MPASAAASATLRSSAPAPARDRRRRRPRSRRSRGRAGSTTPGMPPSRTSRFEATPITVTGTSAGSAARKSARSSIVGRAEQHLGRAADAKPGHRRRAAHSAVSRPRTGGRRSISVGRVACCGHHATRLRASGVERRSSAGQALRPVGDRAGAEADDEVAGLAPASRTIGASSAGAGSGSDVAMAVRAQARRPARRGRCPRSAPRRRRRHRRRSPCRHR